MATNEYLRNYILRNVIKKVHIDKNTLTLNEDKTELTDRLLGTLLKECAKYGLDEESSRTFITQTTENINSSPSIIRESNCIRVSDIAIGQHFKLFFKVEKIGLMSIEVVCMENNTFLVLRSDIPGLAHKDVLYSLFDTWSVGYELCFNVERNGKRYPNNDSSFQIGVYQYMEKFNPSYIHLLFDTEDTYSFEEYVIKRNTKEIKYANKVKAINNQITITCAENIAPTSALFIVTPNEDGDTATLTLNIDYIKEQFAKKKRSVLNSISMCCDIGDDFKYQDIGEIKEIREDEPGAVQCNDLSALKAIWTVTAKPIIRFL